MPRTARTRRERCSRLAYESLERSSRVSPENSRSLYNTTSIAGVLLPVAERIDPGLVDEYLWRSLAMRQPRPWETSPSGGHASADVLLAMMLARYDRPIARSLVEPLAREPVRLRSTSRAAASCTRRPPRSTRNGPSRWSKRCRTILDSKLQSPKNSARLAVATVLGRAGDQRFRNLQHSFLHLWVPDIEDNDPYN